MIWAAIVKDLKRRVPKKKNGEFADHLGNY
jgi:hypothetical protein